MWDLDTLIRQNNQAALDWMMRSRKVEQVQEPKPENWALSLLAEKMKAGPPEYRDAHGLLHRHQEHREIRRPDS